MIEKEFIPYSEALALKELGFDEVCFGGWNHPTDILSPYLQLNQESEYDIPAPTFSQAFRWFRDKNELFSKVYIVNFGADEYCFDVYSLFEEKNVYENFSAGGSSYCGTFLTYEEAELACLIKLIEIVKIKTK
jgi:hypothetical protein